jgi:hypothetical protein
VHATSVANEVLEELQALPWTSLAHAEGDPYLPDDGLFEGEVLVVSSDPDGERLVPIRLADDNTIARGWRDFEVETFVTWVQEGSVENAYKRMTVIVSWVDRDSTRTRRVQAFRAPTPEEEAMEGLAIFITSVSTESHELDSSNCWPHFEPVAEEAQPDCGTNNRSIRIRAVTTEPVANVLLSYVDRYGALRTALMTYFPDRGSWETTIPAGARRLVNGRTEFVVTAADPHDSANEVENDQTVVFLHPLSVPEFTISEGIANDAFCVDPDGVLLAPVGVTIDLVGADANMLGAGIPLWWAGDPEMEEDSDGVAQLATPAPWGGRFVLELDPDDPKPPTFTAGSVDDPIRITVGPITTIVTPEEEPFTITKEFKRHVVPEADAC